MDSLQAIQELRDIYLDLVKKTVGDFIYDVDQRFPAARSHHAIYHHLESGKNEVLRSHEAQKYYGLIYPQVALTMIGMARLEQLEQALKTLIAEDIKGDFLEAGVWRGGACLFMRAFLKAYQISDRQVWLADSFAGFPAQQKNSAYNKFAPSAHQALAVSQQEVQSAFEKFGLWDQQVQLLVGYFAESIPQAPVKKLALLRLDADFLEPTALLLNVLYPKLVPGGYLIIDDYLSFEGCRQAVDSYRQNQGIHTPLIQVDPHCVYWRKEAESAT